LIDRALKLYFISFALLFLIFSSANAKEVKKIPEVELTGVFIKSLIKHVSWPASKSDKEITICVLGNDPVLPFLHNMNVEVKQKNSFIDNCHIFYFGTYLEANLKTILTKTYSRPILTIGSSYGFAKKSGIVEFHFVKNQIVLKVNRTSLEKSEIEISPTLLEMSDSLYGEKNE
jgi:hypothetical protein